MDMIYAFLKHFYGEDDEVLASTMNGIEYVPHMDADWGPVLGRSWGMLLVP